MQLPVQYSSHTNLPFPNLASLSMWPRLKNGDVPPSGTGKWSHPGDSSLQTWKYHQFRNIMGCFTVLILVSPVLFQTLLSKVAINLTVAQFSDFFLKMYQFQLLSSSWHCGPTFCLPPSALYLPPACLRHDHLWSQHSSANSFLLGPVVGTRNYPPLLLTLCPLPSLPMQDR